MFLKTSSLVLLALFYLHLSEGGLLGPNETTLEKLMFHLTRRYAVKEILAFNAQFAPAKILKIYEFSSSDNKATIMVGNFSMKTSHGVSTECSLVFNYKYTVLSGWYPKIISVDCPDF